MSEHGDGGFAFPRQDDGHNGALAGELGMSCRFYAAVHIAAAFAANVGPESATPDDQRLAAWSFDLADALLAEEARRVEEDSK